MSTRITCKRTRPNPLFQEWLEELYSDAKAKKSKLEPILSEALNSISRYPVLLNNGQECAILKGFDKRLCNFLDKRLEVYNQSQADQIPESNNNNLVSAASTSLSQSVSSSPPETTIEREHDAKAYKPAFRSGGYAILIGLLEYEKNKRNNPGLTKAELIKLAQPHAEESFIRPKPNTHYTAWSSMSNLVMKGLVKKEKNRIFSLTPTGKTLAEQLLVDSSSRMTTNDIIFRATSSSVSRNTNGDSSSASVISPVNSLPQSVVKNEVQPSTSTSEIPPVTSLARNAVRNEVQPSTSANVNHEENIPIINLPAGTFDIVLIVDKHEVGGGANINHPTVAQFSKFRDLKFEFRSLKVGDFTWVAKSKVDGKELVLPHIIERKRMDDLAHSIKDGRYHEQKFRLRKCNLQNVIFLIEDYGNNRNLGLPMQTLTQALTNTRVQDGFTVHHTGSLTVTINFLAMMTKRLAIRYEVLCALSFYATGSYQKLVGTSHLLTQRTVSRCVREVSDALNSNAIMSQWIVFPQTRNERSRIKLKFQQKFGLPGVLGCIDCTHVALVSPVNNEHHYYNRKGYHSLNVQMNKNLMGRDADPDAQHLMTFEYFNKSCVKSKQLTVTETFIKILLQLRGMSVNKALAITEIYETPMALYSVYSRCSQREGLLLLAGLKAGDVHRKVGPSISAAVYRFFTK